MYQVVLVAVFHSSHNLPKKHLCGLLAQTPLFLDVLEQLSALQELHDYGNLHIFECEAVVNLDYVLMVEGLQYFGFNKDAVNITH